MIKLEDIHRRVVMVDGCWEWQGAKTPRGYGKVVRRGRTMYTHRATYALTRGMDPLSLPSTLVVRHDCDNPCCCNPDHLRGGTHRDNYNDMVERGRRPPPPTHCPRGHLYDEENSRYDTRGKLNCRQCNRVRNLRMYQPSRRNRTKNNPLGLDPSML